MADQDEKERAAAGPALDPDIERRITEITSKVPPPPAKGTVIKVADIHRSIDLLVAAGKQQSI